jgi:hypothetical protein
MNYQEIVEALKAHFIDVEDEDQLEELERRYDLRGFKDFADEWASGELPNIGKWKEVDSECHNDEDWSSVRHFIDHHIFIEITGYYTSYEGTSFEEEWDGDIREVFPVEKTITVYEPK